MPYDPKNMQLVPAPDKPGFSHTNDINSFRFNYPIWSKDFLRNNEKFTANIFYSKYSKNDFDLIINGVNTVTKKQKNIMENSSKGFYLDIEGYGFTAKLTCYLRKNYNSDKFDIVFVDDIVIKKNNTLDYPIIYKLILKSIYNICKDKNNHSDFNNVKQIYLHEISVYHSNLEDVKYLKLKYNDLELLFNKHNDIFLKNYEDIVRYRVDIEKIKKLNTSLYTKLKVDFKLRNSNRIRYSYKSPLAKYNANLPLQAFLIKDSNNKTKGGILFFIDKNYVDKPILYIEYLFIQKKFRKLGLAKTLIGMCESFAKSKYNKSIALLDTAEYQAPNLYYKLGYTCWNNFSLGNTKGYEFAKYLKSNENKPRESFSKDTLKLFSKKLF